MSRILTAAFFHLTLSAPAFAGPVPAGATVLTQRPTGDGKPDAISCYESVPIGSHIRNLHCKRNSEWALIDASYRRLPQTGYDGGPPSGNGSGGFSAVPNAGQHTPLP